MDPIADALDHINPARHIRKRAGFSFVLTGHSSLDDAHPEPLIQALDLLCLFPGTSLKPDAIADALDHINPARHIRKRAGFSFVLTGHSSLDDAHPEPLIQALDLLCLFPGTSLKPDAIADALDHINPARHIRKRAGFSFVLTGHSSLDDAHPEPLIQALDLLCLFPGTSLKPDAIAAALDHINPARHIRKRTGFSFVLTGHSSLDDAHPEPLIQALDLLCLFPGTGETGG